MKTAIAILFITLCILFMTCKKDNAGNSNTLIGKWKLTATYGGAGPQASQWEPVPSNINLDVQFYSNGTLNGTNFPNDVSYVVKDSVTLKITSKDQTIENYRFSIKDGVLQMSPTGPAFFCTEGCEQRFNKE